MTTTPDADPATALQRLAEQLDIPDPSGLPTGNHWSELAAGLTGETLAAARTAGIIEWPCAMGMGVPDGFLDPPTEQELTDRAAAALRDLQPAGPLPVFVPGRPG